MHNIVKVILKSIAVSKGETYKHLKGACEQLDDETGWSPYLCMEDAYKLDEVRDALRQGDIGAASKYGKIYELRQVTNV